MTEEEFLKLFADLINNLNDWDILKEKEKENCWIAIENMFKTNLKFLLSIEFENQSLLDKLFLTLSNPEINVFSYRFWQGNTFPFLQAFARMRALMFLPEYKQLYLLIMEIICQFEGVAFNPIHFLNDKNLVAKYGESTLTFVEHAQDAMINMVSLNYQNIRVKLSDIFKEIADQNKIMSILLVFNDHLRAFLQIKTMAKYYQVDIELKKQKFPEIFLSQEELAWFNLSEQEKIWVNLCKEFKEKFKQVCEKHPELLNLTPRIEALFSYQPGETLSEKQKVVYAFLSSAEAYPLLRCKNDLFSISEKIRHFILKCFGLATGERENKAYCLTQKTFFASKTYELAFKLVEQIPHSVKT